VPRSFDLKSDPLCTGIPTGVEAYSLNVTVTNTAGPGHLVIYPQGGAQPTVSSINYVAAQTIANAVIVPAGTNGGVTVVAGVSGTHLIIDINGYFIDQYNPGVSFHAVSSNVAPAILAENTSTVDNAVAVQGVITSPTPGSFATGVRGISNGYGVYGSSHERVRRGRDDRRDRAQFCGLGAQYEQHGRFLRCVRLGERRRISEHLRWQVHN
jgi:hypothetical protein